MMRYKPYSKYKLSGVEWLGKVPKGWAVKRLKHCVALQRKKKMPDSESNYLRLENIESWTGKLTSTEPHANDGDAISFEPHDVLFGKLRPYLAKAWLSDRAGVCSSELLVLRPLELDPKFLALWALNRDFVSEIDSSTFGTKMPRAEWNFIGNMPTLVPNITDQRAIAAFLDRETGRIDALVAKKERLIELLKEKRQALITRAVTKGLDPNAKMKDSGVEWLGQVPEGWEVTPFTKMVTEKSDYRGRTPEKIDDGVLLITARNIRMGFIDYECSQEYISDASYVETMKRGFPKNGDILFTSEAPLGNVALVDREDVALAQRVIRFRMNPERIASTYALFAMMSAYFQDQLKRLATGSTAEGIKASKLFSLRLLVPSLAAQRAITTHLDHETTKLDALAEKTTQAIEKLKEYRAALISAAVTGKIDLREAAT
ncbi:MAG: restriction endonuclease subunit S [Candidatus Hydrogenedentota bacterium]